MSEIKKAGLVYKALAKMADDYDAEGKPQHAMHIRAAMRITTTEVLARFWDEVRAAQLEEA